MKLHPVASALLLAACAPPLTAQPPSPSFGETVEVNVVNVDVQVTDRGGRRVTGLKREDFELLEDGRQVPITNFEALETGNAPSSRESGGSAAPARRAPEEVWNLAIFVDDSSLQPAHRARALRRLNEFLAQELVPGDRVMLATYDAGLSIRVPFTGDFMALARGLQRISTLVTSGMQGEDDRRHALDQILAAHPSPFQGTPCPPDIVAPAHAYAGARRQEALRAVDALAALVNSLSGVPGRKAVLHISDGIPLTPGEEVFQFLAELCGDHGSSGFGGSSSVQRIRSRRMDLPDRPAPSEADEGVEVETDNVSYKGESAPLDAQAYSIAKNLQALAAHANANRVTLYTLQASGLEGTSAADASFGPDERLFQFPSIGSTLRASLRGSLQLLADETGGRAILDANDPLPDLSRMREDFSSSYSLGFTPLHNRDSREHKLTVRVKRPDLRLRYRQSYRDKPALEKVLDRTLATLYYGIEDNPLDVTVEIGEQIPAEAGQVAVPVRLRIPLFKLAILNQNDIYQGKLRLMVAVRDEQGGTSAVRQVEVPLSIPRKEVLNAMGRYYVYTLTLKLKPGLQHVAVAVRDEVAASASYLSRPVDVGAAGAAAAVHP